MLLSIPAISSKDLQSEMNYYWLFKRVAFSGLFWVRAKFVVAFRTYVCYCNSAPVCRCSCRQKWISPREMQCAETISFFENFIARAGKMRSCAAMSHSFFKERDHYAIFTSREVHSGKIVTVQYTPPVSRASQVSQKIAS